MIEQVAIEIIDLLEGIATKTKPLDSFSSSSIEIIDLLEGIATKPVILISGSSHIH